MIQNLQQHIHGSKRHLKLLFASLTLLATASMHANPDVSISKNLFLHRAFSANTTRELLMEGHVTTTDFDGFFGEFAFTGAYQRSWEQNESQGIGALPFWSGSNTMTVGTNISNSSLDAYQFGLGTVTQTGSITLNPIIDQGGADLLLEVAAQLRLGHADLLRRLRLGGLGLRGGRCGGRGRGRRALGGQHGGDHQTGQHLGSSPSFATG